MPTQEQANTYLEVLRRSGVTNMFGAGPYVEKHFNIDRKEASKLVLAWMATYEDED